MIDRIRWAESCLNYRFADPTLLAKALTHRSASADNNERLEFLGDAFLSLTIAERLFALRPHCSEGELSRARASLVNGAVLASIAREMAMDTQVIVGKGELRTGGASRGTILADALEAVIGAVLLDGGHEAARALIGRIFEFRLRDLPEASKLKDAKTRLQEWLQARGKRLPVYRVEQISGKDHSKTFAVSCVLDDDAEIASGAGRSRRRAEQAAASAMLAKLIGE